MKRALFSLTCLACISCAVPLTHASAAERSDSAPLDGFGTNIPLSFAVRQIVPGGYVVNYGPGVDQRAKVSWSGGANWRSVLENTAKARGLDVAFDGQRVRIERPGYHPVQRDYADRSYDGGAVSPGYVQAGQQNRAGFVIVPYRAPDSSHPPMPIVTAPPIQATVPVPPMIPLAAPAPSPAPVVLTPAPVAATPIPVTPKHETLKEQVPVSLPVAALPQRREARVDSPPAPPVQSERVQQDVPRHPIPVKVTVAPGQENFVANGKWHAAQGDTLDQVLGDWAEKGGWHLVYKSRMIYTLQAPADFAGGFLEAASALVSSVEAPPRPLVVFHKGNSTLVIYNAADQAN